ncbi:MAG: ribosomal protein S18-alanine N-acetyltransferase [Elusimicrobia bacterium]|nr:ribosomal protein S18-alanine N-acetyltransferase [Elusimicrobiota bacterium]
MKPSVRAASAADLEAVLAIERGWDTTPGWTRAHFDSELSNPRSRFVVAQVSGAVQGYAVFWTVPPEAQILDLAVSRASARKGIGRFLLGEVLALAKRAGLKKATLEVRSDNAPALSLYRAAGFAVVGVRPKFYNGVSDAVLMDRDLA